MNDASSGDSTQALEARVDELIRLARQAGADPRHLDELAQAWRALVQENQRRIATLQHESDSARRLLEQYRRRSAVTVHDLKAPITISLLNLELMEMEQDPAQTAFYLSGVRRELEFMLDTIANLLELERPPGEGDELRMDPVPLAPLVEGVIGRMSVLIADKPELTLQNAIPAGLPPLKAHAHRLTRVFNNLFSNAIKYTDRGHVRASAESDKARTIVRVIIEDTGNGIEPERLGQLFKYYHGDTERLESTGIGLAFVKQVVDAHQGKVWLESERGRGTRVFLELPCWDATE
jgi:signal transduction histidine kinase